VLLKVAVELHRYFVFNFIIKESFAFRSCGEAEADEAISKNAIG
jgi:hypothetical protein